jgi:hypothetical protein
MQDAAQLRKKPYVMSFARYMNGMVTLIVFVDTAAGAENYVKSTKFRRILSTDLTIQPNNL